MTISTEPSPSSEVISFHWSNLIESHLDSSVPFQIAVNVTARKILRTIVDEGASVSIISSTTTTSFRFSSSCASHRSDIVF